MDHLCRSQRPRGLTRRSVAARLLRSWVRIPPGAWIFICCECCVLSGRGLCDELITRPEQSYRLWCVVVCDLEKLQEWGGHDSRWVAAPQKKKGSFVPMPVAVWSQIINLQPLDCWDRGFETRSGHECSSIVFVVFVYVAASATCWSLVQRSLTGYVCV